MRDALRRLAFWPDRRRRPSNTGVLIRITDHAVNFSTTDGDVFATESIHNVSGSEVGACVCSYEVLRRLVDAADTDRVRISETDDGNRVAIKLGGADAMIPQTSLDDWSLPPIVEGSPMAIDAGRIDLLASLLTAASSDVSRPALCGVHFGEDGIAATDGQRIAVVDGELEGPPFTIPRDLIPGIVASFVDGALVTCDGTRASFVSDRAQWVVPLVAVSFPRYRHVIPADDPAPVVLRVAEFIGVLQRVAAVVGDSGSVRLEPGVSSAIQVEAEGSDAGRIQERVAVTGNWQEPAVFSVSYLVEALRSMDSEVVEASLAPSGGPLKMRGDRLVHVLMPQRVT